MVAFNEIPYTWQVPGNFLEVRPNDSNIGIAVYPTRGLIMAQATTGRAFTPIPGHIYTPTNIAQVITWFGNGSMAVRMYAAAVATNPFLPIDIIVTLDAPNSVAATWIVILGGNIGEAGVVPLIIAGKRLRIPVLATDTMVSVVARGVALINADPTLPVTAATVSTANSVIQLISKHGGSEPNQLNVAVYSDATDVPPAGMTVSVATQTTGTVNPDCTPLINAISGKWYTDIAFPWTDTTNLAIFGAELDNRYTAMVRLDAHGYVGKSGTYGQIMAWKVGLNSRFRTPIAGTNLPMEPWVCAAALMGAAMRFMTDDPARQLRNRLLTGITGPLPADRFLLAQRELLLENGISTFGVAADGTMVLERIVTEYLTTADGTPDPSYHDIMAPKVASRIRYDWRTYLSLRYPTAKLAPDGSLAAENDRSVATPKKLKGSWTARCTTYEKLGWIQNSAANAALATFEIDANDKNRVNAYQPYDRIGNLMVFAGVLAFS